MQCHRKNTAPCGMRRGSATSDGQFAYFTPPISSSVYRYEWSSDKWEELPSCPQSGFGLVIINKELTAVGGTNTRKLLTLRERRWVEEYPPMKNARSSPAVVSTCDGEYVIVMGGDGEGDRYTTTVQLFQVKSRRWYALTDIPKPLPCPIATICGDKVYVIGYGLACYSCSVRALPSIHTPIPLESISRLLSWTLLPTLPAMDTTLATLCGEIVLTGGLKGSAEVNSIYQLVDGQWVQIGSMAIARRYCLAASLSPEKIIIVGGLGRDYVNRYEDMVEECVVV